MWGCPKDTSKYAWKADLNTKKGWQRREAGHLRSQLLLREHIWMRLAKYKDIAKDSLPESGPTHSLDWTEKNCLG